MEMDPNRFGELIDELSLALVMLDPEDLIALGEVLERIEKLHQAAEPLGVPAALLVLTGMRKAVEAIILARVPDKNEALEPVGDGVSLLQDMVRHLAGGLEFTPDLKAFETGLKKKTGVEPGLPTPAPGPSPKAEEPGSPPGPAPTVEEAAPPVSASQPQIDFTQDQDLFFSFLTESLEHIETIEINIINLEQSPENLDTINSIFRPFHTIKGVAGFLNLTDIHVLTHHVENLLDEARNERLPVTSSLTDLVLDAVDLLKKMFADLQQKLEGGPQPDADLGIPAFLDRIEAVRLGQGIEIAQALADEESRYSGQKIGAILVDQGLVDQAELEHIIENQQQAKLRMLGEIALEKGVISAEELETALRLQDEDKEKRLGEILIETGLADPAEITQAIRAQEDLRGRKLGEILVKQKQAGVREVTRALREQRKAPMGSAALEGRTVKVDTVKLDSLIDLVGELVIAQSLVHSNEKILSLKDQKIVRDLGHMSRITSELQRTAMAMRMVPIRQTFQKMIRLVRDLSHKSAKQIELFMQGEETEIDRNMVEAIYDPLVHMIRNSVDHGMDPPQLRAKNGKLPEGRITLRAFHKGGNVVIEIEDDGQGLNRDRIVAKAVERGMISSDDQLNDTAVYNLIFQPGFSTAEQVTDVSGRGVGMDVVRKAIDRLRGKIEVNSKRGQGTTITIRLPLTLAIIDGMIVRVGRNRYILPTMSISESFRPGPGDYHTVKGQGEMIKVRDKLLPLIRLDQVLEMHGDVSDPQEALVVVVENENQSRCLMVDEVLGKQEVVIKSLGERLKHVRSLAGGSILGDGQVGLILDINGLFEVSDQVSAVRLPAISQGMADGGQDLMDDWGMGPA
ncbi:MAG: chemotaxis protein CheW [Proteobacteria bacterium]|nr:chemotaxis protein CheW [Pseudomonadota bacterium]